MKHRGKRSPKLFFLLAGILLVQMALVSQVRAQEASRGSSSPATSNSDVDWSKALVESTMKRYPDPATLGRWQYPQALYLWGTYQLWQRTKDQRYFDYMQRWVDSHVDDNGNIDRPIESLDNMLPGNLLIALYRETKQPKYKLAAAKIRERLNTYPRTTDGGLWHANDKAHTQQLWLDGMYMSMPFLVRYGQMFDDGSYANDEAVKQILIYSSHLHDPSKGLLYHAYDETGTQPWADPTTHHSAEFWCRAMGWYGMAIVDILEILPANHPKRPQLISVLQALIKDLAKYQDSKTGLWYQIVDKGSLPDNWQETSSSSMYSYTILMAVQRGYVDKQYNEVAQKGYQGVLTKISLGPDGMTYLTDICEGTNLGDLAFYLARKRDTNDLHGLGAFLIMNELFMRSKPTASQPRKVVKISVTNPTNEGRVEDVVLKIADLQRTAPDFNAQTATVTLDKDGATGDVEAPSQADDLNGDGKPDELAFQIELRPRQTRTATISYGDGGPRTDYPKRTNAKFAQHYDGMGWESETIAWRLYFDKRNAMDLWGKQKPGLYLEMFSGADYKYQEESPLARDIYNVGKSLGAGGVGALVDGQAQPVADVDSRNWKIISSGPVRSIIEFSYQGWKISSGNDSLVSRITQWAGERGYEHLATLSGPDNVPLVAGFSRKPNLKEISDDSVCTLAIWGPQVVKAGTGATESLPNQNLGLAVFVPDTHRDCRVGGDPQNYLVRPQVRNGSARWYVLGAWDQETAKPIKTEKEFAALVKQESARLAQPAVVTVLGGTPPSNTTARPASDVAKLIPAAEVRAAFEKGIPLVDHNGRNYSVIAGRRDKPGQSELHDKDLDVIYVVQGSATFVTGGKMVDAKPTAPGEVRGSGIEGGETQTLSKDDVIVVPAGVPHWFKDVQGIFFYFVVKVQQP